MKEIDLLVVGNGFDIAHNLFSKYEHFYRFIEYSINSKDLTDFYKLIQENFKITITTRLENKGLRYLREQIILMKENFFVKYFINYKKIYNTWHDLETEVKNILIAFDFMFSNLKFETYQGNGAFEISDISQYGQYAIYSKNIIGKWFNIEFRELDDFRKGWVVLKNYPSYKRIEFENFLVKFKEDAISQLFKEFKELTYLFETYLNIFAEPELIYYNFDYKFKKILSFNYTSNASKVFQITDENCFYIHGRYKPSKFVNKLLNENIIIGIDNYKFMNSKFNIFTKSDQRLLLKSKTKIFQFISNVNSACFYGYSFDLIDVSSLRIIFKEIPKIFIFYFDDNALISIKQNLKSILDSKNVEEEIEKENIVFKHSSEMIFVQEHKD